MDITDNIRETCRFRPGQRMSELMVMPMYGAAFTNVARDTFSSTFEVRIRNILCRLVESKFIGRSEYL